MTMKSKAIIAISALAAFANVGCVSKNSEAAEKEAKEQELRLTVQLDEDIEETRRLIKAGADVNAQTKYGYTALMYAAGYNASYTAQLIKANADVNVKDDAGHTALMYAAERDAEDVVELLIAAGADVSAKNEDGKTALMLAEEHDAAEVIALLKSAGAKE
ncbi:MAG: hypothetical protein HDR35_03695 [Treponema sp.]|nr:hypothetical protein [Treponema sp.]